MLRRVRATILTISITYSECVSVAVVIQVCKAHAPRYMMMCGPSGCKVFFHLSRKRQDFREKKLLNVKCVAQWLRCCATNRKVAGSIPAGVSGIFNRSKILPIALWPWGRLSL